MKRLTETMVFFGSLDRAGQRLVADAAAAARQIAHRRRQDHPPLGDRAGTRPRRCAPRRRANGSCRGRCRPHGGGGAGRATRRVRRSAAVPSHCSQCGAAIVDVGGEALDEHQGPHLLAPRRRRRARRRASAPARACARTALARRARARASSISPGDSASSSASRHSICCMQEIGRHRRVVLGVDRDAGELAQVGGALAADPSAAA